MLVSLLKRAAPMCPVEVHSLSSKTDDRDQLAQGEVDVVIGNWPKPPSDLHLDTLKLTRVISTRCAHFGLIPGTVASSLRVQTTGRPYCERFVGQLPVVVVPPPIEFPRMMYDQLWHPRTHAPTQGVGCASKSKPWRHRFASCHEVV